MSSPVFADDGVLDWDGSGSFSGWIGKVRARAVAHLQLLDDRAELIRSNIRALEEYQALRARGTGPTAAADLRRTPWLRAGIATVDGFYLSGRRTLFDVTRASGRMPPPGAGTPGAADPHPGRNPLSKPEWPDEDVR